MCYPIFQQNALIIKWSAHALHSRQFVQYANNQVSGDRPRIKYGQIKKYKLPFFSNAEQKAIVAKIEELFSDLDNAVENLMKAHEQLKIYRRAVLNLTEKTEQLTTLKSVILELNQGWSPKCQKEPSESETEWGVIKTTAVQSCKFDERANKKLPQHFPTREQHVLMKGDILVTRAGPRIRVGVCCLIKEVRPRLLNCDKVYRLKVNLTKYRPQFLEYVLNSPSRMLEIEKLKTGGNDSGLNLTQTRFLKLMIPNSSLTIQDKIITEIEEKLSICDNIQSNINEALDKSEALRQSILKKAFEGKLLDDQELEQVRKSSDWEPAEKLLERIKGSDKAKKAKAE